MAETLNQTPGWDRGFTRSSSPGGPEAASTIRSECAGTDRCLMTRDLGGCPPTPAERFHDSGRRTPISSQLATSCPGCEELHRAAAGEPCPELRAGFTDELTRHRSRGDDRVHQMGDVLTMLDERVGVAEPLDDDGLLIRHVRSLIGEDLPASRRCAMSSAVGSRPTDRERP